MLAAGLAFLAALVAILVVVTTDDGATWARRAAMLGAVTPVAGAIGTLAALRLARSRGELLALLAVGVRPTRAQIGAVLGGIAMAIPGPFIASSPWADQRALFPSPVDARAWVSSGAPAAAASDVGLRELTMGIQVKAGGGVTFIAGSGRAPARPLPVGLVGVALILCALACPPWIAAPGRAARKSVVGVAAALLLIASFQAAAAERESPFLLLGAPLLLLADIALAGYVARRSERGGRAQRAGGDPEL